MEIGGRVDDGFEPVQAAFLENFARHGELGASCAAYVDGRRVVDLWGGTTRTDGGSAYGPDTLQLAASATDAVPCLRHVTLEDAHLP